jgi:predicted O-methyltransferase YrrM
VDIRVTRSWDELPRARKAGERFDFILIDGTHKFRYVMQDLRWAELVNPGGILAVHDYTPRLRAVKWAVDHFLSRNGNFKPIEIADSLLVLEKASSASARGVRLMPDLMAALMHPLFQLENSVRKRLGLEPTA